MKNIFEIDWLQASEEERKQLYVATKAVADAADTSIAEILDAALGRKLLMGTDYQSNFRRGKIRRSYAKLVYGWITQNHYDIASEIVPELFAQRHTDAWRDYIDQHAITGALRIATFNRKTLGLVERARDKPKPEYTLRLGEEFCFHFTSPIDGFAIAFQDYQGEVHPIPLGMDDELITPIEAGEQYLPLDENDHPVRLVEDNDLGSHRFILVCGDNVNKLTDIANLAKYAGTFSVHHVYVEIKAC